jgi:hypothetical protein
MDCPTVNYLECGLSIPMVNMNRHIAEAHQEEKHPAKVCKSLIFNS